MTAAVALLADEARALTDQIKTGVEAVWHLITRAYTERAWSALGYTSWDDYCTREFGTSRLRLPREERAEVVSSLRESGLSIPAISAATGLGYGTVQREVAALSPSGYPNGQPEREPVAPEGKLDAADCIHCGETFPITQLYEGGQGYECDPCVQPADPIEALADGDPELAGQLTEALTTDPALPPLPENYMNLGEETPAAPQPKPITGIDGKTYNPKPSTTQQPKRKPLPETFDCAKQDLRTAVARVANLMADDRLEKNKDQITGANLSDLIRARDALTRIIQQLEG